jgi:hypothetical protein
MFESFLNLLFSQTKFDYEGIRDFYTQRAKKTVLLASDKDLKRIFRS